MAEEEDMAYELMKHALKRAYTATEDDAAVKTHPGHHAMDNCIELFKIDYAVEIIDNKGAKLCDHYPSQIVLMGDKGTEASPIKGAGVGQLALKEARDELQTIMARAAASRCRHRFVAPVIYFNGQYVCRSATLSGSKELAVRMVSEAAGTVVSKAGAAASSLFKGALTYTSSLFWGGGTTGGNGTSSPASDDPAVPVETGVGREEERAEQKAEKEEETKNEQTLDEEPQDESESTLYEEFFKNKVEKDKELMSKLNILHIFDLMVEDAKVKYGMVFSSSEKADEEKRYKDYQLYAFPYPGCEFFAEWTRNNKRASGLHYDWNESQNNAELNLGDESSVLRQMDINWDKHKEWDLEQLTTNYLKAMVGLVATSKHGMLVHCISGWDRTPLFISLLRLSLWADGLVHPSLEPAEMMYLTLAYDWYLFGHNYPERTRLGQEILPFCFSILPKLLDKEFSAHTYATFPAMKRTPRQQASPLVKKSPRHKQSPSPTAAQSPQSTGQAVRRSPGLSADIKALAKIFEPVSDTSPKKSQLYPSLPGSEKLTPSSEAQRMPKGKTSSPKSAVTSPAKAGAFVPTITTTTTARSKSYSPAKMSAQELQSPSKELSESLTKLSSAASPRKRSIDEGLSGIVVDPSPSKKLANIDFRPQFATIGEQIRKVVEQNIGKKGRSQHAQGSKENVNPNQTSAEVTSSPGDRNGKSSPDEVAMETGEKAEKAGSKAEVEGEKTSLSTEPGEDVDDSFEMVDVGEWDDLPERHKRLLSVSYMFTLLYARSTGKTTLTSDMEQYMFGSFTGYKFPPMSLSSILWLIRGRPTEPDSDTPGSEEGAAAAAPGGGLAGERKDEELLSYYERMADTAIVRDALLKEIENLQRTKHTGEAVDVDRIENFFRTVYDQLGPGKDSA